jgi:hypothetical protein
MGSAEAPQQALEQQLLSPSFTRIAACAYFSRTASLMSIEAPLLD